MTATWPGVGGYAAGPAPATRAAACDSCGRPVNPGAAGSHRVGATCILCLFKQPVAIPRARRLIRAGIAKVGPEVRALGRGPNRRALRVAKAQARRERIARRDRTHATSTKRMADVIRSTAAEKRRRAQAEVLKEAAA